MGMKPVSKPHVRYNPVLLAASVMLLAAVAVIIVIIAGPRTDGGQPGMPCESLQECVRYSDVHGDYEAVFNDSYSSPGGTATTRRVYSISNDQLARCISCEVFYSSGYGDSSGECPGGEADCSSIMKQSTVIGIVKDMNVTREFGLGSSRCFQGEVGSSETFDAIVCFDGTNRVVNYAEQRKRPYYAFNVAGYEAKLIFA